MRWLLLAAFVFSASSIAQEEKENLYDGNHLLERCQLAIGIMDNHPPKGSDDIWDAGWCGGLVSGVAYASPKVCQPKGATAAQEIRVVVKYLNDNPGKLNLAEGSLVQESLAHAFPCTPKK